jgi:hypothetical protein
MEEDVGATLAPALKHDVGAALAPALEHDVGAAFASSMEHDAVTLARPSSSQFVSIMTYLGFILHNHD